MLLRISDGKGQTAVDKPCGLRRTASENIFIFSEYFRNNYTSEKYSFIFFLFMVKYDGNLQYRKFIFITFCWLHNMRKILIALTQATTF